MRLRMQSSLCRLAMAACVMLSTWQAGAFHLFSFDEIPAHPFDERLSTNWLAAVRAALPPSYAANGSLDFHHATNDLAQESRHGNLAAQTLWGFSIIVQSQSREATAAGLQLMRAAADKGNLPAMMNLGFLYEDGRYLRRNYNEAFLWFSRAADLGAAEAQLQLGGCYHYGLGVTPNFSMAAKYYQLAADQTNYVAMKSLGYLLMNGYGIKKNDERAKYWLLRAAKDGGNRRAMYDLSVLYNRLHPDTNASLESFKWTKQSAELGDAMGAWQLALFYLRGWGATETNLSSYRLWLYTAAKLGATDAQYFVGQAYRTGDGVPTNMAASLMWLRKAAAKNHPEALYDLAVYLLQERTNRPNLEMASRLMLEAAKMGHRGAQMYCSGMWLRGDFAVDCDAGRAWLEKAGESGWPNAEFLLFHFYFNGLPQTTNCPPFTPDKHEGIKWLRRAAAHGSSEAQSVLAVMMIRGLDVAPDPAAAEKLLREAAGHGFAQAQNDLGFAILHGDVTPRDLIEAGMWCKLATSDWKHPNVSDRAAINLSNVMKQLSFEQQDEVDHRAANFHPVPVVEMNPMIDGWETNADYQPEDGRFGH